MLDNQGISFSNEGGETPEKGPETPPEVSEVAIDSVTGYREPDRASSIKPKDKTAFLKGYRESGDISAAANRLGYKASQMLHALKIDKAFNTDFKEVKLDMKHELEGLMYTKGLTNNGHKERLTWLEAQFPEEYGKKKQEPPKKENPVISRLLKEM